MTQFRKLQRKIEEAILSHLVGGATLQQFLDELRYAIETKNTLTLDAAACRRLLKLIDKLRSVG